MQKNSLGGVFLRAIGAARAKRGVTLMIKAFGFERISASKMRVAHETGEKAPKTARIERGKGSNPRKIATKSGNLKNKIYQPVCGSHA